MNVEIYKKAGYTHYLSYKKVQGSIGTVSSGFYTTRGAVQLHVDALKSIAIEGSIVVAEL